MQSAKRSKVPVVLEGEGLEVRTCPIGGGMSAGFFQVPKGADLRPALTGLEDDLCQCPHWGYLLKGRLLMHTTDGDHTYEAGDAFYWAPGHAPEALEDCEYVDFSPTDELNHVLEHIKAAA